ncbi:Ig-like domain-containing protein [Candidatus Nitrososphaera sp. FF02]|uniref:Ig-like domain-containing protein n=1 Tax=Candidatus Nitrososphaera sp. FF02 TaxID=3398226 RepID=UPI0039ED0B2A
MQGTTYGRSGRFALLIALIVALPLLAIGASSASAQAPVMLTINSQHTSGQALTGMWTTLSQNGATVDTGFTPKQFSLASGQQYVVAVSNYGSLAFDRWADNGSTNPSRTVSISQATTLTAIYRTATVSLNPSTGTAGTQVTVTGSNFPPSTVVSLTYAGNAVATTPSSITTSPAGAFTATFAVPSSSTPGQNTVRATAAGIFATATFTHGSSSSAVLTVNSQHTSGQALTGMWTTLSQNGQTVATGFTPRQFTVTSGQQYVVGVGNYGSTVFDHWADNGSTSPTRTVSIAQATTLTAVYRNTAGNQPPVANGQSVGVNENSSVSITLAGSDPEGQPITFHTVSAPQHGVLSLVNPQTRAVTYTPYGYYDGPDSFTFVTNDGNSDSAPATVNVSVANTAAKNTSEAVIITTELNNHSVTGMRAYLYQNDVIINEGFTHLAFDVNNNQQYTVTIADFENYLFDSWVDTGSTDRTRTISINDDTMFMAAYRTADIAISPSTGSEGTIVTVTGTGFYDMAGVTITYNGLQVATAPSSITTNLLGDFVATFSVPSWSNTGPNIVRATDSEGISATEIFTDQSTQQQAMLTIGSQNMAGGAQSGFYTTLSQNGQVVDTGFTPAQFDLATDQQYVVTVSNYGQWVFDHWADNGSTSQSRTVSITSNTQLVAVYRTL